LGDFIPSQAANAEYAKDYTLAIPSSYNRSNLRVVAMIVKSDNTLLNAQQASAGQKKDFQIVK